MKEVTFGSLKVGDVFSYGNVEYTKLNKVKVSCCRFTNAQAKTTQNKIGLKDDTLVKIQEETA